MFSPLTRICLVALGWFIISNIEATLAGQIDGRILGLNNNRLVFGVGTDDLVFANSSFLIVSPSGDTIYSNTIETATNEISLSHELDSTILSIPFDSCLAVIETAEVATNLVLNVSCLNVLPVNLTSALEPGQLVEVKQNQFIQTGTGRLAGISLNYRNDESELWGAGSIGYENLIAYRLPPAIEHFTKYTQAPAPFFAALMPNLKRKVNNQAFLTTSLYYRFNDKHLDQIFDGKNALTFNSLYGGDSSRVRWYPNNTGQGKRLFDRIDNRPREISIGVKDPALQTLALYFADILSRDRQRIRIVGDDQEADLYLLFVPYPRTDPKVSLEFLYDLLLETKSKKRSYREAMSQAKNYLERLSSTADSTQSLNYLRRIDQIMKEDLGIFPLFQPTLYLVTKPDYSNVRFDEDNYLDFEKMVMLHLPGSAR